MYPSPRQLLCTAVSQIQTCPGGSHVPANEADDHWSNMRMDSLIGELRKQTTELRQQGEDIHQQMCYMYNVFKDITKNHGRKSSAINNRFVDALACDSEDCYDAMDWKVLENRWKNSQQSSAGSVDSGYKSDYPSLSDVVSCPSYPKKPKILMGTKLIGWQKSREGSSVLHHQSRCQLEQRKNCDVSTPVSPCVKKEQHLEEIPREDSCLLSPPLRIVRFSDNVKTSRCKRIVPKYKKNRLSLKGTPSRCESFASDCFEDPKTLYGKIVYYDLDRVEFLTTALEESQDAKKIAKDFKRSSPKEICYPQASGNEISNRISSRVVNFKKPSAIKSVPNSCYKRISKVDANHVNTVSAQQKNTDIRYIDCDPNKGKDDISDSYHIYEEIIYDVSAKKEESQMQIPPSLPVRPKELWKNTVSTPCDENTKYYRRKSNLLRSVSNKMEKLAISNS